MSAFISYKHEDFALAKRIHTLLESAGVRCYIDALDPALQMGGDDLTATLMRRIEEHASLLAVVSDRTKESWWVPFEIGVASRANKPLATYTNQRRTDLPDYLRKWPVLSATSEDQARRVALEFARVYRRYDSRLITESERSYQRPNITSPGQFHRELKSALGQP